MMILAPKKLTTPSDFFSCPVWRYDDEDDLYHPVLEENDIPESERDLSFRAIFTTPAGKKLDGYVVGISRVFSIGLFGGDRFYHANKNLGPESRVWMEEYVSNQPEIGINSWQDLFPLQYTTQMMREGYRDFSGIFDLD